MVRRRNPRPLSGPAFRARLIVGAVGVAIVLSGCTKVPPNVVLITVDTLRADRLGAYGYAGETSPGIDALATGGVVFNDASTTIPRTTQAIASLLTSRHPSQHGVMEIGQLLRDDELSLAEILREAGYHTMAISANPVASQRQGLDQGFEIFVDREELTSRYGLAQRIDGPNPMMKGPAEAVTEEAIRHLEDHEHGPYFLWLLYMDPHWLYNPPAGHNQVVDWQEFDFYSTLRTVSPINPTVYFNLNGRSAEVLPEISKLYDAEVRYTDNQVEALIQAVRRRADGNNTLIVFTSDHGESLGEHGYFFQHGALVYQPSMRIPLIFNLPGEVPEGRRIDLPVSIVDVAPTILSLLGHDHVAEPRFSGSDLSRLWRPMDEGPETTALHTSVAGESGTEVYPHNPIRHLGGRSSGRLFYARDGKWVLVSRDGAVELFDSEADPLMKTDVAARFPELAREMSRELDSIPVGSGRWRMVREGSWKLIRIPELRGVRWELYDLATDPMELWDQSTDHPEIVKRLQEQLDAACTGIETVTSPAVPEVVQRQLEALGYIDE